MRFSMNPVISEKIIIALVVGILTPGIAVSQVVPPTPRVNPQPEAPTNRFGTPIEGWAIARYSVLVDGSTDNVRAIERMPEQIPEREIRDAVERWTFEPATSNGTAVEWHNNEAVIVFDADPVPPEPSPMFVRAYREIETLLVEGENEDALRSSRRLLDTGTSRLTEIGVGLVQNARIHMALGDEHSAYPAIQRATDPRTSLLEPSELTVALEYRNTLELALGDVVGALETFARRQALGPVPETDRMARSVEAIESALDGDAAIAVKGKILDDVWVHDLVRRTFAIGDLEGDLRTVSLECDRRTAEFEYSVESEWTLPESWGACMVIVTGRRDTEFVFYGFR